MDFIHRTTSFRRKVARTLKSDERTNEYKQHAYRDSELDEYKYSERRLNNKSSFISTVASSKDSLTSLNAFFTSERESPTHCRDSENEESPESVDTISSLSDLTDSTRCDKSPPSSFPQDSNDSLSDISLMSYRHLQCSMSYKSQNSLKCTHEDVHDELSIREQAKETHIAPKLGVESDTQSKTTHESHIRTESSLSEATLAIHQARRELQRMVLTADDEDSDSESITFSESNNSNVVRVSEDDFRRFRNRLSQLEELCYEQTLKQKLMEESIQQQVELRTRNIVQAAEEQIAAYKRVRDVALESTSLRATQMSPSVKPHLSFFRKSFSEASTPSAFDKLLHPIRFRQQVDKRSSEKLLDDRVSESSKKSCEGTSVEGISGEVYSVLRVYDEHVAYQDAQLENAKELLIEAVQARSEAKQVACEAVELADDLDKRLQTVTQENLAMKEQIAFMKS
uniref:AlNc14C110G6355 protein n=1 Tax=Albugo laibachii Nc14 TaxID=890382 RepID=F0WIF5_9STRA|nr:AlNc14C110G6355 [Albugo laibachii Nc14]|eukprot:CCA21037.1 AlNc14C110G6355 [Albugo laibachii Nc14]